MSAGGDRDQRGLRVRAVLDDWGWAIALVAVVVIGVGGYVSYTAYAAPGTTVEERQVSNWEGNGSYTTSATVTEPNPLYAEGTELSDQPAYFLSVTPRIDGTFAFEYRATRGGAVDVTVEQTLVLRSVTEGEGSTTEYWRIEEPLDTATASGVGPGESVRSTFSRNVSRVVNRAENVTERLDGAPGNTQILVVSRVELEGEINARSVERSATYRLPIQTDVSTYAPGTTRGEAMSGSTAERITSLRTYGPLWRFGGPAASIVGIAVLLGLAYGRYEGRLALTTTERARLEFESTRQEFDDWITTARLPPTVLDRPKVEVDSLSGLVDTAIDVDARVFERPDGTAFYVPHEGLLYVYTPPEAGHAGGVTETDSDAPDLMDDTDDVDES